MKVTVREWTITDAEDLAAALNNEKIHANLRDGLPLPYTKADAEYYINSMLGADKNSVFAFAVEVGGKAVGSVGVFRQSNIHYRTAELGYYLAEGYWGKGIMTQAVKAVCKFVFDNSDILRIYAEPFATNHASCRVLAKAGFSFEGVLVSNAYKNGKVLDMKLYALVREDECAEDDGE